MRCFLRRRTCVWGRDIEMVTLRVADPVGRGFLRPGPEGSERPRELVVRPVHGEEHRALDAVRRADGHWLRPWEATLPRIPSSTFRRSPSMCAARTAISGMATP